MNNEKSEEMTSNVKNDFVSIIITSKSNFEINIIILYKEYFFRETMTISIYIIDLLKNMPLKFSSIGSVRLKYC